MTSWRPTRALEEIARSTTASADALRLMAARTLLTPMPPSTLEDAISRARLVTNHPASAELAVAMLKDADGRVQRPEVVPIGGDRVGLFWQDGPHGPVLLCVGARAYEFMTFTAEWEVSVHCDRVEYAGRIRDEIEKYLPVI